MRPDNNIGMDEVALHLDTTSNAGWSLAQRASDLSELNQWFYSNMSVLGDYIGTDSAATQFKAAFQPQLDSLDKGTLDLVQGLYGLGQTLDRLIHEFAGDDHATATALRHAKRR